MLITDVEIAIINILKDSITDLAVEAYPDNPSSFKMIHPKGTVLVHYSGSKYDKSFYDELIAQVQTISFDIILIVRSLRGNGGVYETLDKIREALTGFEITDISKFQPIEEEFIVENSGIWQYGIRFAAKTKHVEKGYAF